MLLRNQGLSAALVVDMLRPDVPQIFEPTATCVRLSLSVVIAIISVLQMRELSIREVQRGTVI